MRLTQSRLQPEPESDSLINTFEDCQTLAAHEKCCQILPSLCLITNFTFLVSAETVFSHQSNQHCVQLLIISGDQSIDGGDLTQMWWTDQTTNAPPGEDEISESRRKTSTIPFFTPPCVVALSPEVSSCGVTLRASGGRNCHPSAIKLNACQSKADGVWCTAWF